MSRLLIQCSFLIIWFGILDGEVYQDRPKIKTSDGNLILEPALNKNIYLLPNGPKSNVFVGDVNILNARSEKGDQQNGFTLNDDVQNLINGPTGILQRLGELESKNSPVLLDELYLNISIIWKKIHNVNRKVNHLQTQLNDLGRRVPDECESDPCQHGGTCLNLLDGHHCLCPSNWEGKDCDIDVNECRNFAGTDLGCQNDAICINRPGAYECLCRSGWFGLHCTRKSKDCSGGDFEMCGHGKCLQVSTGEGITCICHQGWATNGTGVECLTDVNECESHQGYRCSVNPRVECINLPGSFRCGQCPAGYEGDGYTCSDINECTVLPNGGCNLMVACQNTVGSRICGPCPPGYQGDGVICSWRGSCSINHGGCHPSAQCVEHFPIGGQGARCICPVGMEGDGIGLNGCYISTGNSSLSCEGNPCGIHGQCHTLRLGYTCVCQRGYGGWRCDIPTDLCASNPCQNGGFCRLDYNSARGFRCECTAQYSGTLCQVLFKTCGGVLDAEEGNIVYPISNTTYNHNARCAWVIHTVPGKVINVTFSKFNLEDHSDCLNDFLQIHDGRSSVNLLVGRFCGNSLPNGGNIVSSHNYLYLWFRSDATVSKKGFALHWTSSDPICGGELDATKHGHISSPGSPGKYPPNRDCFWHLTTNFGKRIQIHFFALDIETHANCSFDYLAIYDGMRISDPLLARYCNSSQPAPIQSSGSEILIYFHSDAFGAGTGFQLAYAPIEGIPGCGGYFTADKGEIISPSYNGSYLSNMLCEYKIKTSPDTKIKIDFKLFRLERSFLCKFDYLKLYDGPSADSPLVGKFCGITYPKLYTTSSNVLFLRFKSDFTVSSEGFKLSYQALCQISLSGDSGVIKSPGYPFDYPKNKVCEYTIRTTPGKAIQLVFQDFDIEDNNHFNCQYDHVEIRDGPDANATLLGRYCGGMEHVPPVHTSTHNYMHIVFRSDMSVTGAGFYANYTTIDTECGGIFKTNPGLINHPSSTSEKYRNDQSCTWILIAPEGMHIMLTWNRFVVENMPGCESDYLELVEEDDNNDDNNLGKFCGSKHPPALTTSTNRLKILFNSDSSVRLDGFSVSYTFLDEKSHCGGTYHKRHGFIYSPGWPDKYQTNRDCTWTITVPVGQQIRLNISKFDLESPNIRGKCNSGDFLEIRNGVSQFSPLIGTYCGKFETKRVLSLSNVINIRFYSDFYLTGNGFKIEWDGSLIGCGGTLTSSTGSLSSPNYPETYHENSECSYKIVTSLGSRIRIAFTDLDLESTTTCRDDYVEIFDGKDPGAPSLGRHCVMSAGLNNIETSTNYAYIKFRSDFYLGGKGFLINYYTICNNNLTGRYGVIESPDYPDNYPLSLNCLWNINVSKGNKIKVIFNHFDIFKSYYLTRWPRIGRRQCDQDYLQWKESSDPTYSDKICGNTMPSMITTKGNSLQMKFATGLFGSKTGFRLEWINYGCGGHIKKRAGSVSVNASVTSSGEIECEWLVETSIGTSVNLFISGLYLSESQNCTTDAVEIYNGQDMKSPILTKICHRDPSSVQSTANFMFIRFVKRSNLRGAYFTSSFRSPKAACGGRMESLSGFIYSKNYPKNYDNNLDCTWLISVPFHHRIELNFLDFDLDSYISSATNEDSCSDSIKIYDNEMLLTSNYTKIVCPNSKVSQIITKYNKIIIQFTSDNYGSAKGFKINFSVTCGALINAVSDGIITNDRYLGGNNKSCIWTIIAVKLDQRISLTFTHISVPKVSDSQLASNRSCSSSYIRVFDGDDDQAPQIDEYCGKKAPPMIVSRGNAITVVLGTYSNNIVGHFSAHYSPLDTACGGTFTSEEGTIASPNYPHSYPNGADCEWVLSTSPGNRVYVTFEQFSLEYSEGCNEDYVEIRENNGAGKVLGVYCGNDIPINTTAATKLYIKFHSNDKSSGQDIFLLHYGFLHGNDFIGIDQGEITSPLYPHQYLGAGEYTWRILSTGKETITLTIDSLEIHSYTEICYNKLSIYDGYDDTAPLLDELCGILPSAIKVLETTSNVAYIKLTLDESNTGALFYMRWKKSSQKLDDADSEDKINCGSNNTTIILPGNRIAIQSPNYPKSYDNDLNCEWVYQSTIGRHLSLSFQDFELEEMNHCVSDYVSVYSSDNLIQWKPIKEVQCKSQTMLSQDIDSSKYMKIRFKTDSSIEKKGFRGQIKSMCGGYLTDLSGVIGFSWNDLNGTLGPRNRLRCNWTVKVRPGRVIKLQFLLFNITNDNDDCAASVTLHNGDTIEAPLLSSGKYCGYSHENRYDITTSSNTVFISYVKNTPRYSRTFETFKIYYEENNIECGLTSKLSSDHSWEIISSPNYPSVPVPYSECVWVFNGPPGEILRIDFIDRFDLDDIDGCGTEVVELRDGSSNLSPLIDSYCSEKPPTKKTSSNTLYIKYATQLAEPRNGFKANVSLDVCGGTIISDIGEITSPGYPHMNSIQYNTACVWTIRGSPRLIYQIIPNDVDLPESETPCATKVTIQEKIQANNTFIILRTLCNDNEAKNMAPIETSGSEVIIKYEVGKPSEWYPSQKRGFRFSFNSSRPACGGTIKASEGYLFTPSYPLETTIRYCQWFIEVPDKTRRVRLELLDIETERHTIGMYNDNSFQSLIYSLPVFSNSVTTRVFESSGNKLALFIWLNPISSRHKFKAKFSSDEQALCGGELIGLKGQVVSPNMERSYNCDWNYDSKNTGNEANDEYEYNTILVTLKLNSSVTTSRCRSFSDPKLIIKSVVNNQGMSYSHAYCSNIETSVRLPSSVLEFRAAKSKDSDLYFILEWNAQPCGGIIHISEEAVNILKIPGNYNGSLDCAWIVMAPINNRVEFKMEGSFQFSCDDEFVRISQGATQKAPIIGDYCKSKTLDQPLTTNFRYITIEYHSKAPNNNTNIKLMAKTAKGLCGGVLGSFQHVFVSPNYPKNYDSNQECTWTISANLGNRISLTFIDRFVVEDRLNCSKDVVIIYDWKDDDYNEIARVCGRQIPKPFNSTYNKMKVVLRTDDTTNMDGFKAKWTPICGGRYTASDNEHFLYSPGFPHEYSPMMDCTYDIVAPNDETLLLKFLEFELEGTYPDCKFDNLTITASSVYDFYDRIHCGNEMPSIITQFSKVSLIFKSDYFVQRKGFKLSYVVHKCGGQVKEPMILTSNINEYYEDNMNCTWHIQAPTNKIVVLKFLYVDLENYDCSNDYVAVFNGLLIVDNNRLALMCGYVNSTTVLRSQGNKLLLQFVSDENVNNKGFKVEVMFSYAESMGCGGQVNLTSPTSKTLLKSFIGNNSLYESYLDCHWTISSPPDTIVKIEFSQFHVAPCRNVNQTELGYSKCDCDLVEIKDGINPDSLTIGTFCGHTIPPTFFSSGNVMSVRLSTDGEIESQGFEAQLSFQQSLCGKSQFLISDTIQRVISPDYVKGILPRGLHCIYYFTPGYRSNSVFRISFITFELQAATNQGAVSKCNKDKLEIINHPHVSRNMSLGKDYVINHDDEYSFFTNGYYYEEIFPSRVEICGNKKPSDLYITGSTAVILTTSPESDSGIYKGFEIEIAFAGFCGKNYTDTQGKIRAPYSSDLSEDSKTDDCYTLITAPENNTISVYFLSITPSYWNENCFLDIYDGRDATSTKLVSLKNQVENEYPVFSTGSYMLLHSHRDTDDRMYYDLNYVTTDKGRGCGGALSNELGRVTSPMYPEIYRKQSSCEWLLETPHGTRIKLHFSVFDLGRICDQNYLQLVDSKGNVISSYCSEQPADYTSEDNFVKIVFITTVNNGGTGWVAEFYGIL